MPGPKALVAGNWKMNGLRASLSEVDALARGLAQIGRTRPFEVMLCPPAQLIMHFCAACEKTGIVIGAQDCHHAPGGAHTGDLSAEMLADAGAGAVIVGHSERRQDHGETDGLVHDKAQAAWRAGLVAIICIGETLEEREAGQTLKVLSRQIAGSLPKKAMGRNTVIAYEPVWAIGSGLTPAGDDVAQAHAHIRAEAAKRISEEAAKDLRLLYGGSVKPDNARALMSLANVNGALVGGASLEARDFLGIIEACGA